MEITDWYKLAEILNQRREELGLSRGEVARRMGANDRLISAYFNKQRRLNIHNAKPLAKVLGLRVRLVLEEDT